MLFRSGHRVRDVAWPSGCLIIGLRRGEHEIVPRGDTMLRGGDYLIVLFSGQEEQTVRSALQRLCDAESAASATPPVNTKEH